MRVTIVGAGPVGLLTACLLASTHTITVLEKRMEYNREHLLNINSETIQYLREVCELESIKNLFQEGVPMSTSEIQRNLAQIATELGVKIVTGVEITSLDQIKDSIVIGADGARSTIRKLGFENKTVDEHCVSYMAQFKFLTGGATKPRSKLVGMSHSFLNGLSGDDMVLTFESMAPPNTTLRKSGTLHIPIPVSVYEILSANGRGNIDRPWTLEELALISDPHVAKLLRIINRYKLGVSFRSGWVENPKVTVLPLKIYRSEKSFNITEDKILILAGDANSGLVYQKGLNKGIFEAIECSRILRPIQVPTFYASLVNYERYCIDLYERERNQILAQGQKIESTNRGIAISSKLTGLSLGAVLGGLLYRSTFRQ